MKNFNLRKIEILLLIFFAYLAMGKLGLALAFINDSASAVWAPTGIALAAFLIFGYKVWPAIFLGAFFVNFSTTNEVSSSTVIAIGNTLEGVVGAFLVNKYASGRLAFRNAYNIVKFTFFAAMLATTISATVGVLTLIFSNLATWNSAGEVWFTWWLGDAVGAITVAPVLLLLADQTYRILDTNKRKIEAFVFLLCVVGINLIIFTDALPSLTNHHAGFLLLPFLVYSAFQFSRKETAIVVLITSAIAIWGTLHGFGPWGQLMKENPNQSLLFLQSFTAVIGLTTFILSAEVLENKLARKQLTEAYNTALEGWSKALDIRDKETEGHSRRVTELSMKLARALGVEDEVLVQIRRGALLHDIGKIFIPDSILFKQGPLSEEEWKIMAKHPSYAFDLLQSTALKDSLDIPYCHHEKWDGSGYPRGLQGVQIPLAARIFCIVDVWDAMRSARPYHAAVPDSEIFEYIRLASGKHFDPDVVKAFLAMMKVEPVVTDATDHDQQSADLTPILT